MTKPAARLKSRSPSMASAPVPSYLSRTEGRISYDVTGTGPLVVLVPGMGDVRAGYRFLAPALRDAGYRVASTDLRGHGDSDTTFASYGDEETASDVIALIEELGGPAAVVGNSMAAGSAVLAAARQPELVRSLVLIGPFVRDAAVSAVQRALLRAAMAPPWAAQAWKSYLPKLYAGRRPADYPQSQRPDITTAAVLCFLESVTAVPRPPGRAEEPRRTGPSFGPAMGSLACAGAATHPCTAAHSTTPRPARGRPRRPCAAPREFTMAIAHAARGARAAG